MKELIFLIASIALTALLYVMMCSIQETTNAEHWPTGHILMFLLSVVVVDIMLYKIYKNVE